MSVTSTWNTTKCNRPISFQCLLLIMEKIPLSPFCSWNAFLKGELHAGVRRRRKYFEAIKHQSCPSKNAFCVQATVQSENCDFCCGQTLGMRHVEVFAPCSIISSALLTSLWFSSSSSPGKGQMKSWLCFLVLSVNPNRGSLIMSFPYATEANCLELLLSRAIPASLGTAPNHYSSILCENEANCLLVPLPQR